MDSEKTYEAQWLMNELMVALRNAGVTGEEIVLEITGAPGVPGIAGFTYKGTSYSLALGVTL